MTGPSLAASYLRKAAVRVTVLRAYLEADDFSDVVREAQEVVELGLKALLRFIGVEPPKVHDVGALLLEYAERLHGLHVARLAGISRSLRKERELAFYGDLDFLPTEQYGRGDAEQAMADAAYVVEAVQAWIAAQQGPRAGGS